ncbi:MAG: hydrogenase formation protein HypD [Bacteroidia bacterium]|nr:hydrogenase formation protein HypD [Bacteroidia bacterium]
MKYLDEYRNKKLIIKLSENIKRISKKEISLMEVCGGHTLSIHRFGIPSLLPKNIKLLSGAGCPVCVTSKKYIDQAVKLGRIKDVIITTYGDLIRVPGSISSLDKEKSQGDDIRMVYSTIEALNIAKENKNKKVIFLGIGFETTAPSSAAAITTAAEQGIDNFSVFSSHKIMKPALEALINEGVKINGYICPGHVSTITGIEIYTDNSGLAIQKKYEKYDTEKLFDTKVPEPKEPKGCICGEILMGLKTSKDCKLFQKVCNPENPIGACMVSIEGACQTFYKFHGI